MNLPFFWIDAFSDQPFRGNPAGVCPLREWLPAEQMQQIAFEHGLSETAFFVPLEPGHYHLRWFTPAVEVDLCGHATLASAHVVLRELKACPGRVVFETRSGSLAVEEREGLLEMDFPARPPGPLASVPTDVLRATGARPVEILNVGNSHVLVFGSASDVAELRPDFAALRRLGDVRVIATAPGGDCDFVSRYFAAGAGVDEDPVTGSAHCILVPYWCERLGKSAVHARQISARSGNLWCRWDAPRVKIAGHAVRYLKGEINL